MQDHSFAVFPCIASTKRLPQAADCTWQATHENSCSRIRFQPISRPLSAGPNSLTKTLLRPCTSGAHRSLHGCWCAQNLKKHLPKTSMHRPAWAAWQHRPALWLRWQNQKPQVVMGRGRYVERGMRGRGRYVAGWYACSSLAWAEQHGQCEAYTTCWQNAAEAGCWECCNVSTSTRCYAQPVATASMHVGWQARRAGGPQQ